MTFLFHTLSMSFESFYNRLGEVYAAALTTLGIFLDTPLAGLRHSAPNL